MKKKIATVRFEIEDEHPMQVGRDREPLVKAVDVRSFDSYLREIMEIPQSPEAEPDEGYYITGLEVLTVAEEAHA